jgi:hypothetical protein
MLFCDMPVNRLNRCQQPVATLRDGFNHSRFAGIVLKDAAQL